MKNLYDIINKRSSNVIPYMLLILVFCVSSCKKLVDAGSPLNSVTTANAFDEDGSAAAVLNGIYAVMSRNSVPGNTNTGFVSYYTGLSSDEFVLRETQTENYFLNTLSADVEPSLWSSAYNDIFNINTAIEGLLGSEKLNPMLKNQLYAQSLFLRAWHYFYLTRLYGEVPLVLTTDYKVNQILPRTSETIIFSQMIKDLVQAEGLIKDGYVAPNGKSATTSRITPNKGAVSALLARYYLYAGDYAQAEEASSKVISQTGLYQLETLDRAFLSDSKEALWNMQPVNSGWNTEEGRAFVIPQTGPDDEHRVSLNNLLVKAFEKDDLRRKQWIDSVTADGEKYYYPTKYRAGSFGESVTEYKMMLRLAEVYLIRAEARVRQNNLTGALEDLDKVRKRAGLGGSPAIGPENILKAIQDERRVELFTEWGDRWLNMRRTGTINQIMPNVSADKGQTWNPDQSLYPVPTRELLFNRNLSQNKGY